MNKLITKKTKNINLFIGILYIFNVSNENCKWYECISLLHLSFMKNYFLYRSCLYFN